MANEWSQSDYLLSHFEEVCEELIEQAKRKNADYGASVGFHGVLGLMPRLSDKFFRLNTLVWEKHAANFESALDTARDLASYAIILAVALEAESGRME